MRVLLEDGFSIEAGTGIGRCTLALASALARSPDIHLLPPTSPSLTSMIRPRGLRRAAYAVWLATVFPRRAKALGADVAHFTNYQIPARRVGRTKYVVTVHDLSAWTCPDVLPASYRSYIRSATAHAVERADIVLCPSDSVSDEVTARFGPSRPKVWTCWNGSSCLPQAPPDLREEMLRRLSGRLGLRKPFLLFVGTIERRKNLATLLRAVSLLIERHDLQLVLAGRSGFGCAEVEDLISRLSLRGRCILAGYLSDEELGSLYSGAELFAYPSLYEGFGIPLVDAMASGLPIVASRIPASEEVAGDAAAYYDCPTDHEALAARIGEILGSGGLRAELSRRGRERSAKFTWQRAAQIHLEAYGAAMGAGAPSPRRRVTNT